MNRRAVVSAAAAAAAAAATAIVSSSATILSRPASASTLTATSPPRVWLDADPSAFVWTGLDCDDDLAILVAMALHQNRRIQLEGIGICGGNAPLRHTFKDAQVLMQHVEKSSELEIYKGYGWRSMQISRKWLQQMNRYVQLDTTDSNEATQALLDAAFAPNKDQKLTVVTIGPPTNLAKALTQNNGLSSRLEHVYMMGGELTHQRLDLNFASDRSAARTVVNANVPTTIIPIQLCAQISLEDAFVHNAEATYCHETNRHPMACALLPKMKQQVKNMPTLVNQAVMKRMPAGGRWTPSPNLNRGFIPWDIVCLLSLSHPELFGEWEYHTAAFPACPEGEPCDRTMVIGHVTNAKQPTPANTTTTKSTTMDSSYDHRGIVRIPHAIRDEAVMKDVIRELLFQIPDNAEQRTPRIMLGFLGPLGLAGTTAMTALGLLTRRLVVP